MKWTTENVAPGEIAASKMSRATSKASTRMATGSGRIMPCLGGETSGNRQYLTCWYEAVGVGALGRCIKVEVLEWVYRNKT